MAGHWYVEAIGPGLWRFIPEYDAESTGATAAPGWNEIPLYYAWVHGSTGGLCCEIARSRGMGRRLSRQARSFGASLAHRMRSRQTPKQGGMVPSGAVGCC